MVTRFKPPKDQQSHQAFCIHFNFGSFLVQLVRREMHSQYHSLLPTTQSIARKIYARCFNKGHFTDNSQAGKNIYATGKEVQYNYYVCPTFLRTNEALRLASREPLEYYFTFVFIAEKDARLLTPKTKLIINT